MKCHGLRVFPGLDEAASERAYQGFVAMAGMMKRGMPRMGKNPPQPPLPPSAILHGMLSAYMSVCFYEGVDNLEEAMAEVIRDLPEYRAAIMSAAAAAGSA